LLLAVHDLSLPGDPADDTGRGAPLSRGGRAFLRFAAELGFHGLQLGPQGETSPHDPSPYDATLFSRSTASIALEPLVSEGLLPDDVLGDAVAGRRPGALLRADHAHAHQVAQRALKAAWRRAQADRRAQERLAGFVARSGSWMERDELYAALESVHGEADWRRWPESDRSLFARDSMPSAAARRAELRSVAAEQIGFFRFGQLIAHEQHESFHASSRALGLLLFGDLQIGTSHRDLWSSGGLLAAGLRMGAPPSRTNPEGQPWGYGVLDPDLYGTDEEPGAAVGFLRARVAKLLEEFDGLRVDHPHGLIDPWVYSSRDPDPLRAVQSGGRLFSSPERPELSRWAIARPEQLDLAQALHGDGRVRDLAPEQVDRYARLFDALVDAAGARGRAAEKLIAEVLSTLPYPVRRVLERHGLGRFRVTQKASIRDAADVYRAENARPDDWIMAGTHDTPPVWQVAERWVSEGPAAERAAYLATRLVPDQGARSSWAERVATSSGRLARAQLADLFVGPARNVMIFFSDWLGLHDVYNRPGSVSDQNWSLRVPPDFVERHARSAREGTALDLPAALAAAFRARGESFAASHSGLLQELDRRAGPAPDQG